MSTCFWRVSLALAFVLQAAVPAFAKTYKIDPEHTTVGFQVRHLFTTVTGRFDKFDGEIVFDPARPEEAKVTGSIDVASINTNLEERDKDLRSPRFFDVEKHPTISFTSTGAPRLAKDPQSGQIAGKLDGRLSMHGVEKKVVLDVAFLGEGKDPWANVKAGFSARARINRKDFGLSWNETLETGGVLVGDDIDIRIDAEAAVQP